MSFINGNELIVVIPASGLTDGEFNFDLQQDLTANAVYLIDYDIRDTNHDGAGVANDQFLMLDTGELQGGNQTYCTAPVTPRRLVLSTNALRRSGFITLEHPWCVAKNARVGKRRLTFTLFDSTGARFVPALNTFQLYLRFKYFSAGAVGRESTNLQTMASKAAFAFAEN